MKLYYAKIINKRVEVGAFYAKKGDGGFLASDNFYMKSIPPFTGEATMTDKHCAIGKSSLAAINALIEFLDEQISDYEAFLESAKFMKEVALAKATELEKEV